ncbi:MAG: hypothetical protein KAG84_01045 [Bacteroidales bacterium]|nr:hypothetical protein [Bacteroidales bacterium]
MRNNSFLFITPNKVENYAHTRINHDYESFVLPPEFIVEIKNKINGSNLLSEKKINLEDIELRNSNNRDIAFDITYINNKPFINLSALGWNTGFNDYELKIGLNKSINFSLDMHKTNNSGIEFFDKSVFTVFDNHNVVENGIISIEV